MTPADRPSHPNHPVACEVCLKEVPQSEATSSEATDYVLYFCGLECYEQWQHLEGGEDRPQAPADT